MKRTNQIMDEIRKTMMPEMKIQTELSVSIANRIYECLEQRNMTQKDLARMMGKTETEVSRWLSGTHNFTIATIAKITKVLGEAIIQPTSSVVLGYMLPQEERSIYLSDSVALLPPLFYVLQQHQLVRQSLHDKAGGSVDVQFGGNVAAMG